MATKPNLYFIPAKLGPTLTTKNVPNQGATPRTIQPLPLNIGGGSSDPVGPQRWPLKL